MIFVQTSSIEGKKTRCNQKLHCPNMQLSIEQKTSKSIPERFREKKLDMHNEERVERVKTEPRAFTPLLD